MGIAAAGTATVSTSLIDTSLIGVGITGGYTRIEVRGGGFLSNYNDIRGAQRGLTIGLLNYARELHGVQLNLLNIAHNNPPAARVLPGVNLRL